MGSSKSKVVANGVDAVETTYTSTVTVVPILKEDGDLEKYFMQFRRNIVGVGEVFHTPYGPQKLIYTDWTASAR